jgi:hypothetical protein
MPQRLHHLAERRRAIDGLRLLALAIDQFDPPSQTGHFRAWRLERPFRAGVIRLLSNPIHASHTEAHAALLARLVFDAELAGQHVVDLSRLHHPLQPRTLGNAKVSPAFAQ